MRQAQLLVPMLAVLACHSGPTPAGASAAAVAPSGTPCAVAVEGADIRDWRTVDARGFTFCVPADWRSRGNSWRRGSASIEWGVGEPRPRAIQKTVASESMLPSGPPPNSDIRRFSETIGGREAELWENRFGTSYYTGAKFSRPKVYLVGGASDRGAANLEIEIYRTVRFATR